ncbi:hypothetical protein SVI_1671 [Shewanella violacea DSS12]|uniref:Uncharacterized protein n=1 Tax=Shewanella violacea (strain JCM 10179 / CIP 106290 / LMG 19151 / DSS12) TaxID=637905 RepID=D4ZIZ3_SHEVD|nr:hypothetical protein SVI_1671 [Shewanella violacea DSS12]
MLTDSVIALDSNIIAAALTLLAHMLSPIAFINAKVFIILLIIPLVNSKNQIVMIMSYIINMAKEVLFKYLLINWFYSWVVKMQGR